jgi:ribonuclease R
VEPYFPAPRSDAGGPGPGSGGGGRRAGSDRRIVLASNRVSGGHGVGQEDGHGGGQKGGQDGMAREGDLVLVQLPGRGGGGSSGRARIVRLIGRPEVARDAIEALMLDRGLARRFGGEVEREADFARDRGREALEREVGEGRRRDLRGLSTFTVDPASAKDFDDAISAERLPDGVVRVWVHIADVSSHVGEGSLVDREARRRGTSVYVPGAVEPMLPSSLSNDACSLVAGVARGTVTVELDLRGAEVLRSAFYRSLISSDERLDYERVDRIFAGSEQGMDPWGQSLAAAREASGALAEARAQAGGLAVSSEEPEFELDDEGHITAILTREQTESHRLIEHLMIAANEAVARHLVARGVPCLYRVHERPEPARVLRLVEQLASLGVPTPPVADDLSPSQAADLMGELSQRVEGHVSKTLARGRGGAGPWGGRIGLTSLVLRSLRQAYYSPRNIGHAGLHSECYCHFTSPIRRYPDLVCHRALVSSLGGGEAAMRSSGLRDLGEWASEREREAMVIERAGDDLARCFALEKALYEEGWEQIFQGEVSGLISAGAFVAFGGASPADEYSGKGTPSAAGGPLYEGMVPVRRMRPSTAGEGRTSGGPASRGRGRESRGREDWWELNEHQTVLHGERSGATIRLGDTIEVRVARVDRVRGRVDLVVVDGEVADD